MRRRDRRPAPDKRSEKKRDLSDQEELRLRQMALDQRSLPEPPNGLVVSQPGPRRSSAKSDD
jgi:hypothetical protein